MVAIAAIAAVFLTPALAHAGTLRGTVVAKQASRHVLVVALKNGQVLSARVTPQQLHRTRIGNRLSLAGTQSADGSLHVSQLQRVGTAKRALLSVVIMKAKARRLLVAGGGSTFSIRLNHRTRVLAARETVHPGEKVDAEVSLSGHEPVGRVVHSSGDAPLIEFSGVVKAMDATSITVTSDDIDTVVDLPDGVVLPPIVHMGSEVEIVASISGSTLTLTSIKLDDESSDDSGGSCVDGDGGVTVHGSVTDIEANSITIQPGDNASPVVFALPDGFTLPDGIVVGSLVEARGETQHDVLTLSLIELQNHEGDQGEIEVAGLVTDHDSGSITIHGEHGSITFAIPDGFALPDGIVDGTSIVEAKGEMVDGVLTLTDLELQTGGGGDG
jgi:hypothetical protein